VKLRIANANFTTWLPPSEKYRKLCSGKNVHFRLDLVKICADSFVTYFSVQHTLANCNAYNPNFPNYSIVI